MYLGVVHLFGAVAFCGWSFLLTVSTYFDVFASYGTPYMWPQQKSGQRSSRGHWQCPFESRSWWFFPDGHFIQHSGRFKESAVSAVADRAPLKISFRGLLQINQAAIKKVKVAKDSRAIWLFFFLFTFENHWNLFLFLFLFVCFFFLGGVHQNGNFYATEGSHSKLLTGPFSLKNEGSL